MHNNNPENSEVFHDTSSELVDNNDRAYNDATSLKAAAATAEANRVGQENAERDKLPDPLSEGQSSPIQEGEVTTLAMYNSPEFVIPLQRHSAIPNEQQEDLQASQNKFQVLAEAETLLRQTSWADMAEESDEESTAKEGEWQTPKKKYSKSKWMEQRLPPPSTRARVASNLSQ
ncbi:hypothetical protein IFM89_013874 [Coptis chinensis]|uniref:Uncharacterized protein n=1 Tax=Coptis chinensis TaxID=261450 RepID=A0A835HCP1_9MAGN|nr:hypothetical protein IFM89_013874 [Coptis chinensis]